MATYAEILTLSENENLRNKVRVACVVAAEVIRNEAATVANHAERLVWAKSVFISPETVAQRMLWAVLAQNLSATVSVINNASDAVVQTAVNNAVNIFAM